MRLSCTLRHGPTLSNAARRVIAGVIGSSPIGGANVQVSGLATRVARVFPTIYPHFCATPAGESARAHVSTASARPNTPTVGAVQCLGSGPLDGANTTHRRREAAAVAVGPTSGLARPEETSGSLSGESLVLPSGLLAGHLAGLDEGVEG